MFKAIRKETNSVVAIKRMSLERSTEGFPIAAIREIKLLAKLNHPNIVRLIDIAIAKYAPPEKLIDDVKTSVQTPFNYPWNFFMVCEYAEHSLAGLLERGCNFSPAHIKCILKQTLEGLAYLHEQHIMHRDIKCSNILVNSAGKLKLADFGISTKFTPNVPHKAQKGVVTLWYRAPELLLGAEYTEAIDMWAVGCVLGELILGSPVFMGKNEQDQLNIITETLGPKKSGSYVLGIIAGFENRMSFWERLRLSNSYDLNKFINSLIGLMRLP